MNVFEVKANRTEGEGRPGDAYFSGLWIIAAKDDDEAGTIVRGEIVKTMPYGLFYDGDERTEADEIIIRELEGVSATGTARVLSYLVYQQD